MARVLVTDGLSELGLAALRSAGHDVEVRPGLAHAELLDAVVDVEALVIRSATKVTADVLAAAGKLVVVGRAGVGVDNVDLAEATRRGVVVVNAPVSNIVSNAEHTMALLLAQARNLPQADAALKAGRWEKTKLEGTELHGKTLGILGLGRMGTLVAQRAHAFGMRIIAHDKYVAGERGKQLGIEMVAFDELLAESDFLAVHVQKTPETVGMIDAEVLARAKPGLRIINTARGGIIDEDALASAIRRGHIGGAALDVFAEEPTTDSPLFELESVVVTPHLGGSTPEAQDKAGITIAEQVNLALAGEFVPYALNVAASEASETVRPFVPLAERLGEMFVRLNDGLPSDLAVEYQGALGDYDVSMLTLSMLKGILGAAGDEPVSFVNAPQLAKDRGMAVRETKTSNAQDYVNLIVVRGDDHALAGTLFGVRGEPRVVMVDDHATEVPLSRHMLIVRNEDRPGMIGLVGSLLGEAGVNVADFRVGRSPTGEAAMMLLAVDDHVPPAVVERLRAAGGVVSVHPVALD